MKNQESGWALRSDLPMGNILKATADAYDMQPAKLLSRDRHSVIASGRHIAMYLMREMLQNSYPVIGRFFGMDHTSVLHAVKRVRGSRVLKAQADGIRAILDGAPEPGPVTPNNCQDCKRHERHLRIIVRELAALVKHLDEKDAAPVQHLGEEKSA